VFGSRKGGWWRRKKVVTILISVPSRSIHYRFPLHPLPLDLEERKMGLMEVNGVEKFSLFPPSPCPNKGKRG